MVCESRQSVRREIEETKKNNKDLFFGKGFFVSSWTGPHGLSSTTIMVFVLTAYTNVARRTNE